MKTFALFIVVLLMTSCGPSSQQIQEAVNQTVVAVAEATANAATDTPEPTDTPQPTLTATPTNTVTPTPTVTPTETPTPTATPDIRIIDEDPMKFLLKASEMPEGGRYYLPGSDWMSINTNEEVISARGVEEGRDYVISTGRVTGWWVEFLRGTRTVNMPEDVYIFVGQYQTAEGAQLTLMKYNEVETNERYSWNYKTVEKGLGDKYIVEVYEERTSGGDKRLNYFFEFTYRNYLVEIGLFDLEKYISHDFALEVGAKVLRKLQDAPLVYPPTPTPTP